MVLAPSVLARAEVAAIARGGAGGRGRDTFSWWCEEVDAWPTCCASRSAPGTVCREHSRASWRTIPAP